MFETPRAVANAAPADGYIQPNFGHALRIWWALFWRTTIIAAILQYGLGLLARNLYASGDLSARAAVLTAQYGGYVLNYAVAFFVVYYVLHKTFRHFRIALFESWGTPQQKTLEPTLPRSARIWWTYTWRTIVYTMVVYVAALLPLTVFVGIVNKGSPLALLFMSVAGFLGGGAASLFAIHSNILDEDFGNFRVAIAPRTFSVPGAEIVAASVAPVAGQPGSETILTRNSRVRGPSNSAKKITCQRPSASLPFSIHTVSDEPTSASLMCESELPSECR